MKAIDYTPLKFIVKTHYELCDYYRTEQNRSRSLQVKKIYLYLLRLHEHLMSKTIEASVNLAPCAETQDLNNFYIAQENNRLNILHRSLFTLDDKSHRNILNRKKEVTELLEKKYKEDTTHVMIKILIRNMTALMDEAYDQILNPQPNIDGAPGPFPDVGNGISHSNCCFKSLSHKPIC